MYVEVCDAGYVCVCVLECMCEAGSVCVCLVGECVGKAGSLCVKWCTCVL